MNKQRALERLTRLAAQRRDLNTEIDGLVSMLRSPALDGHCDATWSEVADALGVRKQTVQKKYRALSWGGVVEPTE